MISDISDTQISVISDFKTTELPSLWQKIILYINVKPSSRDNYIFKIVIFSLLVCISILKQYEWCWSLPSIRGTAQESARVIRCTRTFLADIVQENDGRCELNSIYFFKTNYFCMFWNISLFIWSDLIWFDIVMFPIPSSSTTYLFYQNRSDTIFILIVFHIVWK